MSRHQEWKMIHLLYQYARRIDGTASRVLTEDELNRAGVHCDPDSRRQGAGRSASADTN